MEKDLIKSSKIGLKPAKICYGHIGGKFGIILLETFTRKGWIAKNQPADKHFFITPEGVNEFAKLGFDLSSIKTEDHERYQ